MRLIDPEQITKMMSDLFISKDAVNMTGERQGLWVRFRAIEKAVSEIQTIDAVEVVRCRDCRHSRVYQTDSNGTMQTYCVAFVMLRSVTDDDFCSWGERREP